MKLLSILISSVSIFIIIVSNLYYNIITLELKKVEKDILSSNVILQDILENEYVMLNDKDEYMNTLTDIKQELISSSKSIFISTYIDYKINVINNLMIYIYSEGDDTYKDEAIRYDNLGQIELDKLMN